MLISWIIAEMSLQRPFEAIHWPSLGAKRQQAWLRLADVPRFIGHGLDEWHVRSRSYPNQTNYFDTGYPHGRDQWISAAATSWACIGLTIEIGGPQ